MCRASTDLVDELYDLGLNHYSSTGGDSKCVPHLPPVQRYLPLQRTSHHALCATDDSGWTSTRQHMAAIDWILIDQRKRAAPKRMDRCPPPRAVKKLYVDAGAKGYSHSVEWFVRNYPRASQFAIYAIDPDPAYIPTYKDLTVTEHDEVIKLDVQFVNALAWNETGYVSQELVSPQTLAEERDANGALLSSGKPDGMIDVLNDRHLPTVFHGHKADPTVEDRLRQVADAAGDSVGLSYAKQTRVSPAVALGEFIMRHAAAQDFVVLRLDARGDEELMLRHLLVTGAMRHVDELFLVCHNTELSILWNTPMKPRDCQHIVSTLRELGVYVHEWYEW